MVINANSGSKDLVERQLSNFYPARISVMDNEQEIQVTSVENAIQAMKFAYSDPRRLEAFLSTPAYAKKLGQAAGKDFVYWDGRAIRYNSDEHRELIAELIWAKYEQNPDLMAVLLGTGTEKIVHRVGPENPDTSLPAELFCQILMDIRMTHRK